MTIRNWESLANKEYLDKKHRSTSKDKRPRRRKFSLRDHRG